MHCGNPFLDNKKKADQFHAQFYDTFGVSIGHFMDMMLGFDIVAFDKHLGTPDGTSTKDFITEKYGDEATQLIEDLILH
jgi:hypothetical protein